MLFSVVTIMDLSFKIYLPHNRDHKGLSYVQLNLLKLTRPDSSTTSGLIRKKNEFCEYDKAEDLVTEVSLKVKLFSDYTVLFYSEMR